MRNLNIYNNSIKIENLKDAFLSNQEDYGNCKGYCTKDLCWLNDSYVWGFAGPLACVILFNIYILFIGLRVAYKVKKAFLVILIIASAA